MESSKRKVLISTPFEAALLLPTKPCILTGFELIGSKWKKTYEKGQNFI